MKLRLRLFLTAVAVTLPMIAALICIDAVERHRAAEQRLTAFVASRMPALRDRCEAAPATWGGEVMPTPPGRPPRGPGPQDRGPLPDPFSPDHGPLDRRPPPEGFVPPRDPFFPDRGPPPVPFSPDRPPPPPDHFLPDRGLPPPPPPGMDRPHARPAEAFAYGEDLRSQNPTSPVLSEALKRAIQGRDAAVEPFAWRSSDVEVLLRMAWTTGPCAFVLARGSTDPAWGSILPESRLWVLPMVIVLGAVLVAVGPIVRRIRKLTEAVRRSASASYASDIAIAIPGGDEIGELSRAFEAAAREVRQQLEEKARREEALRRFLSNTTHDVMIPLTVLQGHLATLRERAADGRPLDASVVVSAMDEAHYMASIVHNLATAARLEAAEVDLCRSAVDLDTLVQRVLGRHRPIARELDVSLEGASPEGPIIASADVTLIEQAVSNIVYNAIRHNRPGGHVAVILERCRPDRFRLRVIDDGPGIPEAELSKLVERGARGAEARTRAPEGQGLGLHIAYCAAELHGFSLALKRSDHGGLEVTLEGAIDEG